jgi:molybdopterin-guanine dinucleotide biosynthesis protein A
MGRDKAAIPVLGRTLLERAVATVRDAGGVPVVLGSTAAGAAVPGVRCEDEAGEGGERCGPLNALRHGLRIAGTRVVVVLACDLPLVPPGLLQFLASEAERHAAVVPRAAGEMQVLAAAYTAACLDAIERRLAAGERSVHGILEDVGARFVEADDLRRFGGERIFLNVNTPADLARAEAFLRARTA